MARCPGHDDRTPSLSIDQADNGQLLLRCHAGCTANAICAAVGTTTSALFPNTTRAATRRPERHMVSFSSGDAGRVWRMARARARDDEVHADDTAVYEYMASRGMAEVWEQPGFGVLAPEMRLPQAVSRWASTGHRIVVPLHDGNGQLVSLQARSIQTGAERKVLFPAGSSIKGTVFANDPGVALLCGRLRPPCTVLFGEGLTDFLAIACTAAGYPVLCAPGTGFAQAALGRWAVGARVVIAVDNDEPGERCAEELGPNLYRAGAQQVFRAIWPDQCKDACEVVEHGGIGGLHDFIGTQMGEVRTR
jgi:putative DNA primase/helicase